MKGKALTVLLAATVVLFVAGREPARGRPSANDGPAPGTAVVKGIAKFEGSRPAPTHINMNADPSCAKLHPGGLVSEDVLASPEGGLQNVVVFVSEGLGDRTFDPPPQPVTMEQKGCVYAPHIVSLRANQELDIGAAISPSSSIPSLR